MTYNLPGNPSLKLDGDTIAGIFLGQIRKWNDPKLAALNPGAKLPDQDIVVVHRSDGSGTTFIFTDYLSKVSRNGSRKPAITHRLIGRLASAAKETRVCQGR